MYVGQHVSTRIFQSKHFKACMQQDLIVQAVLCQQQSSVDPGSFFRLFMKYKQEFLVSAMFVYMLATIYNLF